MGSAHLARVRHEPHVHVMVLRKALDLGQHLADVLSFTHEARPLVVQLVVRVDHQPSDAESANLVQAVMHRGCCALGRKTYQDPGS